MTAHDRMQPRSLTARLTLSPQEYARVRAALSRTHIGLEKIEDAARQKTPQGGARKGTPADGTIHRDGTMRPTPPPSLPVGVNFEKGVSSGEVKEEKILKNSKETPSEESFYDWVEKQKEIEKDFLKAMRQQEPNLEAPVTPQQFDKVARLLGFEDIEAEEDTPQGFSGCDSAPVGSKEPWAKKETPFELGERRAADRPRGLGKPESEPPNEASGWVYDKNFPAGGIRVVGFKVLLDDGTSYTARFATIHLDRNDTLKLTWDYIGYLAKSPYGFILDEESWK